MLLDYAIDYGTHYRYPTADGCKQRNESSVRR